jgi:hypothetical protein
MNLQSEPRKDQVILDIRSLNPGTNNEILKHVLEQVIDSQVMLGYSRMYHRHARTSGR